MPSRPHRYRRAGLWLRILRRLHALHWPDAHIAEAINRIPDRAVPLLDRRGWSDETVREEMGDPVREPAFTRRQVLYWRQRIRLPGFRPRLECGSLWETRCIAWGVLAAKQGWGHYVGRSQELAQHTEGLQPDRLDTVCRVLGPGWTPGLVTAWCEDPWDQLRPTQTAILSVLEERGPLTADRIRQVVSPQGQARLWQSGGDYWMTLMQRRGLVRQAGREKRKPLYLLAEGVCRYTPRTKVPTHLDRLLTGLNLA